MFVLNAAQSTKRVFVYLKKQGEGLAPVLMIVVRDGHKAHRMPCSELPKESGAAVVRLVSQKDGRQYFWLLSDIIWNQYKGQIPAGCTTGFEKGEIGISTVWCENLDAIDAGAVEPTAMELAFRAASVTTEEEVSHV